MTRLERLSANDRMFLDVETDESVMNVAACLVFEGASLRMADGSLDRERIEKHLETNVARNRRYRQRLGRSPIAGRVIWVDVSRFDARDHIRHHTLVLGGQSLGDVASNFAAERFDRDLPLWGVLVVDGLPDGRFAIVVKAHHCLADGVGGIELLESLLTPRNTRVPRHPDRSTPRNVVADEILDELDMVGRALALATDWVRSPLERAKSIQPAVQAFGELTSLGIRPAQTTFLDGENSSSRSLLTVETDLDRISAILRARGGTVNDVVIATVALALGRYLASHGTSRREMAGATFRIAIPVNARPDSNAAGMGNDITMMFAEIPVGDADVLRVLDRTRESIAAAKDGKLPRALRALLDAGGLLPSPVVRSVERWVLSRHPANIVLTNVRGPRAQLSLLDAPLERVIPIVPLMPGQALAIAVASYAGRLFWGLHADAARIDDLDDWKRDVEQSFEDLWRAATAAAERDRNRS